MIENNPNLEIEYWRKKALDYEYMYHEQRKMAEGYKKLLEEKIQEMKKPSRCF